MQIFMRYLLVQGQLKLVIYQLSLNVSAYNMRYWITLQNQMDDKELYVLQRKQRTSNFLAQNNFFSC